MAMKQPGRKIYRSMAGKQVDMDLLRQRNELTPAVGNARVNARGDELGAGGKIIKKREELLKDYYKDNPNAYVPEQEPKKVKPATDTASEPEMKKKTASKATTRAQSKVSEVDNAPSAKELAELDDDWIEDDKGNFVPKKG